MMPTQKALLTSVIADSKKGRRFIEICRAQYNGAELGNDRAQFLNENKAFAAGLRALIRECSMPSSQSVLKFIGTIEVELPFDLHPVNYYQDRPGHLYVYGGFDRGRLVREADPLPVGTKFRLNVHEIVSSNGATDRQIEAALGGGHTFDPTTICGFYAAMMSAQSNGKEGHLLNNGYPNLAYTDEQAVNVRWRADGGLWLVSAWGCGGGRWKQGRRVFVPSN